MMVGFGRRLSALMMMLGCGFVATMGPAALSQADVPRVNGFDSEAAAKSAAVARGAPMIVLHEPRDGGVYSSPIGINIAFKPTDGTLIDLSSLKVTVVTHTVLGDLSFDITDRVSDFTSQAGIHARGADIPSGQHTVTISVADTKHRLSERQFDITVQGDEMLPQKND